MLNLNAGQTVLEQAVRLLQLVGLPIIGVLLVIGFMILLTSGKNPRRKRIGYAFSIGFFILLLLDAYLPVFIFHYTGDTPHSATGRETIYGMVSSTGGIGDMLFTALKHISIPLTFMVFYIGILVALCAAKNPQRKRLGVGLMMFSPVVLGLTWLVPYIVTKL
jgi:hypothetical protein